MIADPLLQFPMHMRPRPNIAVAVAPPDTLAPPRDPTVTDYKCSFCKVDNHNTQDIRRKNRSRSGPNGPTRTVEIANAITLALANLFTNSKPNSPEPSVKDPSFSYYRLPRRYLLDSAASNTMHPTTRPFQSYENESHAVHLSYQRTTPALGEGPSFIPTVGRALHIPRALHVPLLKDHLISAA